MTNNIDIFFDPFDELSTKKIEISAPQKEIPHNSIHLINFGNELIDQLAKFRQDILNIPVYYVSLHDMKIKDIEQTIKSLETNQNAFNSNMRDVLDKQLNSIQLLILKYLDNVKKTLD